MTDRTTLIIDADDTLWENNVHFEDATERFLDLVGAPKAERASVRGKLEAIERKNVPVYGYGSGGFTRSLLETLELVAGRRPTLEEKETVESLGHSVRNMPIQFLPDVVDTLGALRRSYRLILFTKGDIEEQSDKVHRSGARALFHEVEVTPEKRPDDYRRLIATHSIERARGWMVGNSPRSDINPALDVGLGAVFIPHASTWTLEHEEVTAPEGARLKILSRFTELLLHFPAPRST